MKCLMTKFSFIILVILLLIAGCETQQKPVFQLERFPDANELAWQNQLADEIVSSAGGRDAWVKTSRISDDAVLEYNKQADFVHTDTQAENLFKEYKRTLVKQVIDKCDNLQARDIANMDIKQK